MRVRTFLVPLFLHFPCITAFTATTATITATTPPTDATLENDKASSGQWRIALNIGREEAFTSMPQLPWGASGCRLPLVVQADFNRQANAVVPKHDTCRFTGAGGEVIRPVREGTWTVSNDRKIQFSLNFPEKLERRDVVLDNGTELICEGLVFSQEAIKEMNERFYEAREETWKVGKELNDISRRKEAPKKWNFQTNQWEKRYEDEPLWNLIGKRIELWKAQGESRQKNSERPNPQSLSLDSGPFPGFEGNVFMQKEGVIKIKNGWRDAVIGTWSAEPIKDMPESNYRYS